MSASLVQKVKVQLRTAGVELDGTVKWTLGKIHAHPEGFHFTCETPLKLQRMAENSSRMKLDLDYPVPAGFDLWTTTSVGFTEKGSGPRVHLDIGIGTHQHCRVFIAVRPPPATAGAGVAPAAPDLKGPLIDRVKQVARSRGSMLTSSVAA